MKRALLTITFSLICLFLLAQNGVPRFKTIADSLQFTFTHATTDTAKLSILLKERAKKYVAHPDLVLDLYNQGILLAQKINDKKSLTLLYYNSGILHAFGKKAEGEAFQYYQKALQEAKSIGYTEGCALSHYSIALIYDHQGLHDKMMQSFDQSLRYIERGFTPLLLSNLVSIQEVYAINKRLDEAYALGKKVMVYLEQNEYSLQETLFAYTTFIETLKLMPKKQIEFKYYSDKLTQLLKAVDKTDDSRTLYIAVQACFQINQPVLAVQYAEKIFALKVEDNIVIGDKAYTHLLLAEFYEKQKNYSLCIQHYKNFMELRMDAMQRTITEEAGFKVVKAESERDLAEKQREIERQKLYTGAMSVIAVLILGFGSLTYWFYRREQQQKAKLAQLNATKDKLFAMLSHDLMSPVGILQNYTMLMDWGQMTQEKFTEAIQRLKLIINNTSNMLENVLHWAISQMTEIKPKQEAVNVSTIVSEQIEVVAPIAHDKHISIEQHVPNDFVIELDKEHLALVLRNLLQNALKFTNAQGKVIVSAHYTEGGKKTISISDNGIGMSNEIKKQLFQIDKNSNRTGTSAEKGTGLGLILTKELVELNGGTIDVASTVGQGTTFVLKFA